MDEELLNEHHFPQLHQSRQSDLIMKHCAGIEEQIRTVQSRTEAEHIASLACSKFENECYSSIARSMLVRYIYDKVDQYWPRQ